MATLISAEGLTVRRDGRLVLFNVNLAIERGEIVTVVGPNGGGKTTLLRALIGSVPSSGRIERAPGLALGYVPQRLQADATLPMTVKRFLRLGSGRKSDGSIHEALDEAGVPDLADRQVSALSGGQFQRVVMARALLAEPDLLVLDEPAQGLDQPGIASLYRKVESIRARYGCGVLIVSHDLHIVMRTADRVIALNGIIWCEGTPDEVAASKEYGAMFGEQEEDTFSFLRCTHA